MGRFVFVKFIFVTLGLIAFAGAPTRFAAALVSRGHTVRVVSCAEPGDPSGQGPEGTEMFHVPELVVPIASRSLACPIF